MKSIRARTPEFKITFQNKFAALTKVKTALMYLNDSVMSTTAEALVAVDKQNTGKNQTNYSEYEGTYCIM